MTIREIMEAEKCIYALYSKTQGANQLTARRIVRPFIQEIEDFNKTKNELIKKYSEAGKITPDDPVYKKAVDEIEEMLNQEIEIEKKDPMKLTELINTGITNPEFDMLINIGLVVDDS
jgi:hypothetical protein